MDNVIPAPLCAQLITCAHVPPLASTSNQLLLTSAGTAAPLLVTEPSFPPVSKDQSACAYSFLRCAWSASSAASAIQHHTERRAPPMPYGAMQSATLQPIASMPWSSPPTPYASAFMAPPAGLMYVPSYMPGPLTQQPLMQAQFEEIARQQQDIEAREIEVQRISRSQNLNTVRDARVRLVMPMTDKVTVMIPCYHFQCNSWNMLKIFCSLV